MIIYLLIIVYSNAYQINNNNINNNNNGNAASLQNKQLTQTLNQLIKKYNKYRILDSTYSLSYNNNSNIKANTPKPISLPVNIEDSKKFILFASSAYCKPEKLINWSCSNCIGTTLGTSRLSYFSSKKYNTAGYVAINHGLNLIIISYRGTTDTVTWMENYNIKLMSTGLPGINSDIKVHSGFWNMINDLNNIAKPNIISLIQEFSTYKILVCGHSLGGALAILSALELSAQGYIKWDKLTVITYGEPRVGNSEFSNYINSKPLKITRVTNYGDIVTVLPPKAWGYNHHQYNLHIGKSGNITDCSIFEEDNNCINDFFVPSNNAHFEYFGTRLNSNC